MSPTITHVGFSDESNWNVGRFRSLGLVTAPFEHFEVFETELRQLLDESQVSEFKWKEFGGVKKRFAAEKLVRFAIEKACAKQLRIDVLVWDIQDSRHAIVGRDDVANLQRMCTTCSAMSCMPGGRTKQYGACTLTSIRQWTGKPSGIIWMLSVCILR